MIKKIYLIISIIIIILAGLAFGISGEYDNDAPEILSVSALPQKVKVGDILTITAEIKDANSIEKVSAIMPFENGADEIQLSLISGDNKSGKWQGKWKCHNTINIEYITTITAINILGKSATREVSWWDDTETCWLSGWNHRIKLTIDSSKVDANLSDFPVLVYLSGASGIGDIDISCVFDELALDANRKKIAVTKSDGDTQCYAEIEKWDDANEQAWLWVKVSGADSILAASDTILYLYYDAGHADNTTYVDDVNTGNSHNVWETAAKMVHHMEENPAGGASPDGSDEMFDSTSNNNDGNTGGTMTSGDQVAGQIDGSVDFDGSNDYVDVADDPNLNFGTSINFTVSAWIKTNYSTTGTYRPYVGKYNGGTNPGWRNIINDNRAYVFLRDGIGSGTDEEQHVHGTTTITDGEWHHIASTYNRTGNLTLYVDGSNEGSADITTITDTISNSDSLIIGSVVTDKYFNGQIDQVRIYNRALGAEEIKADYNSGNDSLITFGSEIEKRPHAPGVNPSGGMMVF